MALLPAAQRLNRVQSLLKAARSIDAHLPVRFASERLLILQIIKTAIDDVGWVPLHLVCGDCQRNFTWPVIEQLATDDGWLHPPRTCGHCARTRPIHNASPSATRV